MKIRSFDDAILRAFAEIGKDVVAELGSGDDLSKEIYGSYQAFRALVREWSDVSELPYLRIRGFE